MPFQVFIKLGAARVMLKPAPLGSGIIAGGAVRSVVAAAGIQNISSKVLGSKNKASNVYAAMEALRTLAARYKRQGEIKEKIKMNLSNLSSIIEKRKEDLVKVMDQEELRQAEEERRVEKLVVKVPIFFEGGALPLIKNYLLRGKIEINHLRRNLLQ